MDLLGAGVGSAVKKDKTKKKKKKVTKTWKIIKSKYLELEEHQTNNMTTDRQQAASC